jgi:DNA-directed RNA polymerase specialized sigma24 family protein
MAEHHETPEVLLVSRLREMAYSAHDLLRAELEGSRRPQFTEVALATAEREFQTRDIPRDPTRFCTGHQPDMRKLVGFMRNRAISRSIDRGEGPGSAPPLPMDAPTGRDGEGGSPADWLLDPLAEVYAETVPARLDAQRLVAKIEAALPPQHRDGWLGLRCVYAHGLTRACAAQELGIRDDHLGTLMFRARRWVAEFVAGRAVTPRLRAPEVRG